MEVVLTHLRDFSCRAVTFDDRKSASAGICREQMRDEEMHKAGFCTAVESSSGRLDIESALAWLRQELMEMRSQDQALIRQLMDLHAGIQELKLEYAEVEGEEDEGDRGGEEPCWDSGSEAGGSSLSSSVSGEMIFYPAMCYLSNRVSPPPVSSLPKRAFCRRSSVP